MKNVGVPETCRLWSQTVLSVDVQAGATTGPTTSARSPTPCAWPGRG